MLPSQYTTKVKRTSKKELMAPTKAIPLHRLLHQKINRYMMLCFFLFSLGLADIHKTELKEIIFVDSAQTIAVETVSTPQKVERPIRTEWSIEQNILTTAEPTPLFLKPSVFAKPTAYLKEGSELQIKEVKKDWIGVKGPNNTTLWLKQDQIKAAPETSNT